MFRYILSLQLNLYVSFGKGVARLDDFAHGIDFRSVAVVVVPAWGSGVLR